MIEPTDEMRQAMVYGGTVDDRLAAVLAIVARDRCMEPRGHVYHPLRSGLQECAEAGCSRPAQYGDSWCVEHSLDGDL